MMLTGRVYPESGLECPMGEENVSFYQNKLKMLTFSGYQCVYFKVKFARNSGFLFLNLTKS